MVHTPRFRVVNRLAIGDPRVCKSRTLGDEKQYALVFVLDRSGSMRRGSSPKIEIATQALARFALATEKLRISVAITNLYRGDARLLKPFSIDIRHVQADLLDTTCGGGTPLADAVSPARELVEAQHDEPLIITVIDDNPSSTDDVIDQIRRSHAPVCSLTIATDCQPGSLSDSASELSQYHEHQEAVYTPDCLDDRLDQFASLLAGL